MQQFFYSQHIPQSEYRSLREKKEAPNAIDVTLPKLEIQESEQKENLKQRIHETGTQVLNTLMPPERHEEIKKGDFFSMIISKLGLK